MKQAHGGLIRSDQGTDSCWQIKLRFEILPAFLQKLFEQTFQFFQKIRQQPPEVHRSRLRTTQDHGLFPLSNDAFRGSRNTRPFGDIDQIASFIGAADPTGNGSMIGEGFIQAVANHRIFGWCCSFQKGGQFRKTRRTVVIIGIDHGEGTAQ